MAAQTASEPQTRTGLTTGQLIERLIVAVALIGLFITGLPQRYASEPWANIVFVLGGGIESLRILHRLFALLLMAEAIYHVLAVCYRWFVIGQGPVMFPGVGDVRALIGRVLANFGLGSGGDSSYRFILKFEYLALVIGVVVLGITGLMLWNPIAVTQTLPGQTIPIARSVHSDHALLLVIVIVLLRVGIALLWHPKRAEIFAEQPPSSRTGEQIRSRRQRFLPAAVVLAAVVGFGLVWFLNSEQTAITTVPRRQAVIFAPQTLPEAGDSNVGAALWQTLRCAFCHGQDANGGTRGEPALRASELNFADFYEQVRVGRGEMPAFTERELPDGYLVHLWAWLTQPETQ